MTGEPRKGKGTGETYFSLTGWRGHLGRGLFQWRLGTRWRERGEKGKVSLRTLEQPQWKFLKDRTLDAFAELSDKERTTWQAFGRWVGAGAEMAMANAKVS